MAVCCHRRRDHETASIGFVSQATGIAFHAVTAAARACGAPGGGWALVAAARAARKAVGGAAEDNQKSAEEQELIAEKVGSIGDGPVPGHIAVIMDGNRRFGRREFGLSIRGHEAGGHKLRDFAVWCSDAGVAVLTVFAFSTENWKRDQQEVDAMMALFLEEVPKLGDCTVKLNSKVRFLCSEPERVPKDVMIAVRELETRTETCSGLKLNICLSYGGRSDVVEACKQVGREVAAGKLDVEAIDEKLLSQRLLTADVPDPDILIRTSGEYRLSNFLVFQLAYAELFFLDKHWPELTCEDFCEVIAGYRKRTRRYGK